MRVAIIGNMNNAGFALARYLRDRGFDADLLLYENEQEHFHPSSDTYDLDYMRYTRRLSWGAQTRFLKTPAAQVRRDLAGYEALIGCGMAPALLWKAGMALDIFIPYGWDLWEYPRYRFGPPTWIAKTWPAVFAQRRGIGRAAVFHMTPTNDLYEGQWRRLAGESQRWTEASPVIHGPTYDADRLDQMLPRTHWGQEFKAIRAEAELMVVSHARHVWKIDPSKPAAKGTHKLLEGWARFRAANPRIEARLVTMEYGQDVGASKELTRELGISDSVVWMPQMSRKDVMVGLLLADIVCGEFQNSWMAAGVFYEALVAAKPLMTHRIDSLYQDDFPELYPVMNAFSPEDVERQLSAYVSDPARYREMGQAGRRWYERHIADAGVAKYVAYLEAKRSRAGTAGIVDDPLQTPAGAGGKPEVIV
jgi:glycosyltransferase involved in cell wall biosynthesis